MGYSIYVEKYDGKCGYFGWFETGGFCFGYNPPDCRYFPTYEEAKEACDKLNSFMSVARAEIREWKL